MRIGLLGPLEIDDTEADLGMRDRAILAALALRPGELLSPEQLADAVWGENLPSTWTKNVQGCVSRLRKRLGAGAIETTASGYRLRLPPDEVDSLRFERQAARVQELICLREWERARFTAAETLAMWRGRPLTDLDDWEPAAATAARLVELRAETEELAVLAALEAGHHHEIAAEARSLVEAAPLRERRWVLLARAYYQAGRQADALRSVRRARVVLREELGLDPGAEIVALEQAILQQDPSLAVQDAVDVSTSCPYPGLAAYTEADADSYFGREAEVAGAVQRVRRGDVLAVVGPSGIGKSSFVRAGVAAVLESGGMKIRVVTPGARPREVLSGLTATGRDLPGVVVDQAEEVFSLCADPHERDEFLTGLAEYAARAAVIVSFRADRTGDLVSHPRFARLVEQGLCLLGPMSAEDLRMAIERPALQAGLVTEPGLVDLLLSEVEGEPGALPLLSHALRETWMRREGRTLTVAGYQAAGGVKGAIAQSAEALYADTPPEDRPTLRELMLRLVVPGPEGEPVRARVSRRTVSSRPVHEGLLDRLVAARLVTSDDGVLMLAHEAVVRSWPRLQGWLEDDVEGLQILHHLAAAADAWQALGRPDSELYRGVRLERALAWQERTAAELTGVEQDFLEAGTSAAASEARATAELARTRGRMIRRLRTALVGAAALLLVAVGAGSVAVHQGRRAVDAATAAQARSLSTEALGSRNLAVGALLAAEAVQLDDSPETRSSLSTFLSAHPGVLATSDHIGPEVGGLRLSPDGTVVAAYDDDNVVSEVDVASGHVLARYDTNGKSPDVPFWSTRPLAFAPDGAQLAVGLETFSPTPLVLLDADTWRPAQEQPSGFPALATKAMSVTFSADGRYVALALAEPRPGSVGGGDHEDQHQLALVWDRADLRHPVATFRLHKSGAFDYWQQIFLDANGRVLYGSNPMTAYRVHPRPGQPRTVWQARGVGTNGAVDLSPDGSTLVAGYGDETADFVVAIDARRGVVTARTKGVDVPTYVDYAPDGASVLVLGGESPQDAVYVLDPKTLEERSRVAVQTRSDYVQASADGTAALTSSNDEGTVVTWDLRGDRGFLSALPLEQDGKLGDFDFMVSSPDGRRVADFAGRIGLIDLATGRVSRSGRIDTGFLTPGAWAPDGRRFVVGAKDGSVRTLDDDAQIITQATVSTDMISGLDYSSDGSRIAVSDVAGSVQLLDSHTLTPVGHAVHFTGYGADLTMAPDGRRAFVTTSKVPFGPGQLPQYDHWAVVDLVAGKRLAYGDLPEPGAQWADFAPDDRHVAVGFYSGTMEVLDTETGRFVGTPAPPSHVGGYPWGTYSLDGSYVVTSDYGGFVRLWDPETGVVENSVQEPHGSFAAAQLRPGTSEVWMYGSGSQAYIWDTGLGRSMDYACKLAGRDLTADEWSTYLGDREQQPICPAD
jgi:DNA-binding SARP family transcriptional activator/WD40 repeat protein